MLQLHTVILVINVSDVQHDEQCSFRLSEEQRIVLGNKLSLHKEKFEDSKGLIRIRKSKTDRQHTSQKE